MKEVTFDQIELEKARDYSCEDADVTLQLSHLLFPKLKEEDLKNSLMRWRCPRHRAGQNGDERGEDRFGPSPRIFKGDRNPTPTKDGTNSWVGRRGFQYQLLPATRKNSF